MKIFIYQQAPDGSYQRRFFAISELETILAHKRQKRSKQRLRASGKATTRYKP